MTGIIFVPIATLNISWWVSIMTFSKRLWGGQKLPIYYEFKIFINSSFIVYLNLFNFTFMPQIISKILSFLDGKKTYVLAILSAVNSLLVVSNVYSTETGATLQALMSALLGGAQVATVKLGIRK